MPSCTRPARPFLCSADARLTQSSTRRPMPRAASCRRSCTSGLSCLTICSRRTPLKQSRRKLSQKRCPTIRITELPLFASSAATEWCSAKPCKTHLQATSINHEADIGNCETCLSNVGRDDDLAHSGRRLAEGPALVCRRHRRVQGYNPSSDLAVGSRCQPVHDLRNLSNTCSGTGNIRIVSLHVKCLHAIVAGDLDGPNCVAACAVKRDT